MKKKIIYGSILAAFLMISLAFIQPVTARESGIVNVVNAIENIQGIAYDEEFQLYIEQIVNDPELTAISESILSAEDNAQLENLLQEFNMVLESNPAYIDLTSYIDSTYGEDIAILQAFSQQATQEDMHNVINSVVSPDGIIVGDNDALADFSATEDDSSSGFSASDGEENLGWTPVVDPDDDITVLDLGDLYPVYAPWLVFNIKDCSYDSISMDDLVMDAGEQTLYVWGSGEEADILPGESAGEETAYPVGQDPIGPSEGDVYEIDSVYIPSLDITIPVWLYQLINGDGGLISHIIDLLITAGLLIIGICCLIIGFFHAILSGDLDNFLFWAYYAGMCFILALAIFFGFY